MQMTPVTEGRERGKCPEEAEAIGAAQLEGEEAGEGGEKLWRQKLPRGREKAGNLELARELVGALVEKQIR